MTRREAVENFLRRFGEPVSAGGSECRALIRPLRYKEAKEMNEPDNLYDLYTGPASRKLSAGDTVTAAEKKYTVRRSDTVLLSGEEVYVWAVLAILPPDAVEEIRLELDGAAAAIAESCTVKAVTNGDAFIPWGGTEPAAVSSGAVRWELTLQNVRPQNGTDLFALNGFDVVTVQNGGKTVYSGCRWKSVRSGETVTCSPVRSMEISAAKRTAEKGEDSGGQ